MEHPHKLINSVQEPLTIAIRRCGSIKAFNDFMNDTQRFFPMRYEWDGISYPTIRKVYMWDGSLEASFALDTLYKVFLMAEDYLEYEQNN